MHLVNADIEFLAQKGALFIGEEGRVLGVPDRFIRVAEADLPIVNETKAHLAYEIELAIFEMNEAMVCAIISFALPFQFLMSYIYSNLTNRNFVVRTANIFDILIFICIVIWYEKYAEYSVMTNAGFRLEDPPHPHHMFMQKLMNDVNSGDFHFDWLLAVTAFFFWIRLFNMM